MQKTRAQIPRNYPHTPTISWGKAACRLGVGKSHLWRVVKGQRNNPPLLAAYNALLAELTSAK